MHGSKSVCEVSGGGCSIAVVHELPPCGLEGKQATIHRVGAADSFFWRNEL